jgi:hypothetical protein
MELATSVCCQIRSMSRLHVLTIGAQSLHKQASSVPGQSFTGWHLGKLRIAISISKLHSCIAIVASTSTAAFGKEIHPSAPYARTPFFCCVADGGNNETGNAICLGALDTGIVSADALPTSYLCVWSSCCMPPTVNNNAAAQPRLWSRTAKLTVEVLPELVATIQCSSFTCIRGYHSNVHPCSNWWLSFRSTLIYRWQVWLCDTHQAYNNN